MKNTKMILKDFFLTKTTFRNNFTKYELDKLIMVHKVRTTQVNKVRTTSAKIKVQYKRNYKMTTAKLTFLRELSFKQRPGGHRLIVHNVGMPVVDENIHIDHRGRDRPVMSSQRFLPSFESPISTAMITTRPVNRLDHSIFRRLVTQHIGREDRLKKRLSVKAQELKVAIQLEGQEISFQVIPSRSG
jgi:hypothetical protein